MRRSHHARGGDGHAHVGARNHHRHFARQRRCHSRPPRRPTMISRASSPLSLALVCSLSLAAATWNAHCMIRFSTYISQIDVEQGSYQEKTKYYPEPSIPLLT